MLGCKFTVRPAAVLCVLAVTVGVTVARAQSVLDQVPADALVVVKVKNLQETNTKVAALIQQFGLDRINPDLADPLASLQEATGVKDGLNRTGELAFVLLDLPKDNEEPPALMLVPVTDFKTFMANFPDAAPDGDLTAFTAPNKGKQFAAAWGSYAAISRTRSALAQKPAGLKVTGPCGKELADKDVVIYADMTLLGPKAIDAIEKKKGELQAAMLLSQQMNAGQAPGVGPAAPSAMQATVLAGYIGVVEQLLKDTQAVTFAVDVDKDSISTSCVADFAPDSTWGQLAKGIKNTDATLLRFLPAGQYIAYGGMHLEPAVFGKTLDELAKPFLDELTKSGTDIGPFQAALAAAKASVSAQMESSFGMLAPTGALGQGSLLQMITVATGDAKDMHDGYQKNVQATQDIQKLMSVQAPMTMKLTVTPNAKTIDGVQFDQAQMQPEINGNNPIVTQMIQFIYGPNGMIGLIGAVDDKHLIQTWNVTDDVTSSVIAAVKNNEDALGTNPAVLSVAHELPPTRAAVCYVAVDTMATTFANYAGQFGKPMSFNLPPNLPPVGISFGSDGASALRCDTYISAQLVQSMIAAGMQTMMQMRGVPGGPGGQPGGL